MLGVVLYAVFLVGMLFLMLSDTEDKCFIFTVSIMGSLGSGSTPLFLFLGLFGLS